MRKRRDPPRRRPRRRPRAAHRQRGQGRRPRRRARRAHRPHLPGACGPGAQGRSWDDRTPDERARFVRLFTDLLDRGYLSRIELYDGERGIVTGETVEGDTAIVQTVVVSKDGSRASVDYAMRQAAEPRWRVWDVRIAVNRS